MNIYTGDDAAFWPQNFIFGRGLKLTTAEIVKMANLNSELSQMEDELFQTQCWLSRQKIRRNF